MKGKLCLVLGGNGFIGSHLVDELVSRGLHVRAFDRFLNNEAIKFKQNNKVEVFAGDIYSEEDLQRSLKGVDYVFHCFSATTPFSSEDDPISDVEKNLTPSIKIFDACVKHNVKKVAFVSSGGAIYGEVDIKWSIGEDDVPAPVSPYGITKLSIEGFMAYFKRKHGLDYIAYRLSNPYGPRQAFRNNQGVIPAFISQINQDQPINVYGDGSASRDYIYIGDAVKMMVDGFIKQNKQPVYNIGSGKQTTLNEIIDSLKEVMGKEINVNYQEAPSTFLKSNGISVKRFNQEFGKPKTTSLKSGLKQTLGY